MTQITLDPTATARDTASGHTKHPVSPGDFSSGPTSPGSDGGHSSRSASPYPDFGRSSHHQQETDLESNRESEQAFNQDPDQESDRSGDMTIALLLRTPYQVLPEDDTGLLALGELDSVSRNERAVRAPEVHSLIAAALRTLKDGTTEAEQCSSLGELIKAYSVRTLGSTLLFLNKFMPEVPASHDMYHPFMPKVVRERDHSLLRNRFTAADREILRGLKADRAVDLCETECLSESEVSQLDGNVRLADLSWAARTHLALAFWKSLEIRDPNMEDLSAYNELMESKAQVWALHELDRARQRLEQER